MLTKKTIESKTFGTLNIVKILPHTLKAGDIVTVYNPDNDTINAYQVQCTTATVHFIPNPTTRKQCSGIDKSDLEEILLNSNEEYGDSRLIKMPETVSPHTLSRLPNVFLKSFRYRA